MHGKLYTHQASQVTIAHDQMFCRRLIDGDQLQLARAAATLLQASEEPEKTQDASQVALKVLGCQTAATLWLQMGIRRYTMRSAEAISARPDTAVTCQTAQVMHEVALQLASLPNTSPQGGTSCRTSWHSIAFVSACCGQ